DSGLDDSLVARAVLQVLEDHSVDIEVCKPSVPAKLIPIGKQEDMAPPYVRFKHISFITSVGPLILCNNCCWVDETDDLTLNIGRPTMKQLEYSVHGLLVTAFAIQSEYISDMKLPVTTESPRLDRVKKRLSDGIRDAVVNGLSEPGLKRFKASLEKYRDNYRVQFGFGPLVTVTLLQVRMKDGAQPVKCKAQRYPPLHQVFLETHMKDLRLVALVRENNRSRWASAARVVPKKLLEGLRMVIDSRRVNLETELMSFPIQQVEVSITHVIVATMLFCCGWFKGY
ncbi:hypothetical protein PHMEG_00030676, partial [Phytophthora megakarya]